MNDNFMGTQKRTKNEGKDEWLYKKGEELTSITS